MKDTTPSALFQGYSPQGSTQGSADNESVQGYMRQLSVLSPNTERQMEFEDELEQPESAEYSDNSQTPLSGRMRSVRSTQSQKLVSLVASIPDDSEDNVSDNNSPMVINTKPKNIYENLKRVPWLVKAKTRVSWQGY